MTDKIQQPEIVFIALLHNSEVDCWLDAGVNDNFKLTLSG